MVQQRSCILLQTTCKLTDVVQAFVSAGADVNLLEHGGHSPLIMASQEGHTDVVQPFVSAGADVNLQEHGGHSPLIMASQEGHTDVVQAFVSAGADVNLQEHGGHSPLIMASQEGHTEIVHRHLCLLELMLTCLNMEDILLLSWRARKDTLM